jgi:hypothetical protein
MPATAVASATADVISLDDYRRMRAKTSARPAPTSPALAMAPPVMWVYWVPVWIW